MKTIHGGPSAYDAHRPAFQHSLWECWVSLMWHNTPVGRHSSHQIWAAAEKSVMNLSAGLVSTTQSRAPPQLHGLSLRSAQGHGLCSEHRDRCGNYLNWRKRKKKASAFQECHRGWVCVGRLWVGFSDSSVDAKGFKHSGIFPSPHSLLSPSHPSPHPPLDLPVVPNRGRERGWVGRDALEVNRTMWSGLPGQKRSVGWVTSRSVHVVIAADTVTREWGAVWGQINLLYELTIK